MLTGDEQVTEINNSSSRHIIIYRVKSWLRAQATKPNLISYFTIKNEQSHHVLKSNSSNNICTILVRYYNIIISYYTAKCIEKKFSPNHRKEKKQKTGDILCSCVVFLFIGFYHNFDGPWTITKFLMQYFKNINLWLSSHISRAWLWKRLLTFTKKLNKISNGKHYIVKCNIIYRMIF